MSNKIFISHRGNIFGKNVDKENTIDYIIAAIDKGFFVEIDILNVTADLSKCTLGHSNDIKHIYPISFLDTYKDHLYIHCKNIDTFCTLIKYKKYNLFFHQYDDITISTNNNILVSPFCKKIVTPGIIMMPEMTEFCMEQIFSFNGIMSDNISFYENFYNSIRK